MIPGAAFQPHFASNRQAIFVGFANQSQTDARVIEIENPTIVFVLRVVPFLFRRQAAGQHLSRFGFRQIEPSGDRERLVGVEQPCAGDDEFALGEEFQLRAARASLPRDSGGAGELFS